MPMTRLFTAASTLATDVAVIAQPSGYDPGPGRFGANVAILISFVGVLAGGLGLARARGRAVPPSGRVMTVIAPITGLAGIVLGAIHVARTPMGLGTGNGRAGAYVAIALGVIAVVLGAITWARARRTGPVRPG